MNMALRRYDKEWLTELCETSFSYSEVLQKAGRSKNGGGAYTTLKNKIAEYGIDISHFTGQTWNKGKTKEQDNRIASTEKYSLNEVFCENSPVTQKVLRGYIERHSILEYRCACCGCDGNWCGGKIKLEVHHKNGINTDNRIENLEYRCPNCHALTDTYKGKNIK